MLFALSLHVRNLLNIIGNIAEVSNTRKRKCWVKPWLAEKHKNLYHGLVSELLLHDKEEIRMFL